MLAAFDGYQAAGNEIDLRATPFGRRIQSIKPHYFDHCDQAVKFFQRQLIGVRIKLGFKRYDFFANEAPYHIDNQSLFFGEGEVHPHFLLYFLLPARLAMFTAAAATVQPGRIRPRLSASISVLPAGSSPWSLT